MTDVTLYNELCPKCNSNALLMLDAYDAPDGTPVEDFECASCGHAFTIVQAWILDDDDEEPGEKQQAAGLHQGQGGR